MAPGEGGGSPGDAVGSAVESAGDGLSTAAGKAGEVLNDIFDGLPWDMDPGSIVDAVTGVLLPYAGNAIEVILV